VLPDNATAASLLSSLAREGDLVLLKASRSARMEEVLQRFN
jgi:UDP-N-acetylmuramyl pentapeptide synthase